MPKTSFEHDLDAEADPIEDFDTEEPVNGPIPQDPMAGSDPIVDEDAVVHEGRVLYRIRSQSPEVQTNSRKRPHPEVTTNDNHLYAWDIMERQDRIANARVDDLSTKPALKRSRLLDGSRHVTVDSEQPKIVRIELPPDHEEHRERRRHIEHLTQLRTAPIAALPRRSQTAAPPIAYHPTNLSTDAFYRAMGGPPPSNRPLTSAAQTVPHHHHSSMPRRSELASSHVIPPFHRKSE